MLDRTETPFQDDTARDVVRPSGLPRLAMLAPFATRSFRFQWPADLLTSWAFEMETLILGWYVLVETNSVLLLTVYGALLYVGTLISPIIGVWITPGATAFTVMLRFASSFASTFVSAMTPAFAAL